jgi:hypothetical protein
MHLRCRYSTGALLIVAIAVYLLSPFFTIDSKKGTVATIDRLVLHSLQVFAADKPGKAILLEEDPAASAESSSVSNPTVSQLAATRPYSGAPSKDTLFFSSSGLSPPRPEACLLNILKR